MKARWLGFYLLMIFDIVFLNIVTIHCKYFELFTVLSALAIAGLSYMVIKEINSVDNHQ